MAKQEKLINLAENEEIAFKYAITSYGSDFDVEGLVNRVERGDIYIPSFQREFVWSVRQASKFIESLLLGLPVPGIFLSVDRDKRMLVIDGQQRLRSLFDFYRGIFSPKQREFRLIGLSSQFNGQTVRDLSPEDKRRLGNSIIHATIVRQDEPDDGNSSIYFIFERLNTGATQLQPQEIRVALYHGPFADLLSELNSNPHWRALFGPLSKRKRDQELILRFFALHYKRGEYTKPMKEFLNEFMGSNRNFESIPSKELMTLFAQTVQIINQILGARAFRPKRVLNAAIIDSIMIGISTNISRETLVSIDEIEERYAKLLGNQVYQRATESSTSDEETVRLRLDFAVNAFAKE